MQDKATGSGPLRELLRNYVIFEETLTFFFKSEMENGWTSLGTVGEQTEFFAKKSASSLPITPLCPLHQLRVMLVNEEKKRTYIWISVARGFCVL